MPVSESASQQEKRIDFSKLLQNYWKKRRIFYWCIGAFFAIGLFFTLASPTEYSTNATIIPEYEIQDRVNEIIESYGLLFGLTGSIRENRTPSYLLRLYPYMIASVDFKKKLMNKTFQYGKEDSSVTLQHYFTEIYKPSLLHTLYDYSFGLPGKVLTAMQSNDSNSPTPSQDDSAQANQQTDFPILELSPDERRVANILSSRINATYDRQTGIISITGTMPEPTLSPKLVKLVLETLHEEASAYKTAKGRLYLDFLESQRARQNRNLAEARQELQEYNESRNQQSNTQMALQSNYETALAQYSSLNEQLQRMKLNIEEQLPTFRILDDITTPGVKIQPKGKLIIFFSLLLGFFVAFTWITGSYLLKESKKVLSF